MSGHVEGHEPPLREHDPARATAGSACVMAECAFHLITALELALHKDVDLM